MTKYDHARYCGSNPAYVDKTCDIRPHFWTEHLPLEARKVWVRWHDPKIINHESPIKQEVGYAWHMHAASDFRLLVKA